jgi:hypothetical protein
MNENENHIEIIPFEFHVTIKDLELERVDVFQKFCSSNNGKALIIELSKGEFVQQVMFNKIQLLDINADLLKFLDELIQSILVNGFEIVRIKVEIPSKYSNLYFQFHKKSPLLYYEWHGKVNYTNIERLYNICENHHVHLSRNALKNESNQRFITLREYDNDFLFNNRVVKLISDLEEGGWNINKQQSELCIYDTNIKLDSGWLN